MSSSVIISPDVFIRARKVGQGPWHKVLDVIGRAPDLSALTRCGRLFFYGEAVEASEVLPAADRVCLRCSHWS